MHRGYQAQPDEERKSSKARSGGGGRAGIQRLWTYTIYIMSVVRSPQAKLLQYFRRQRPLLLMQRFHLPPSCRLPKEESKRREEKETRTYDIMERARR